MDRLKNFLKGWTRPTTATAVPQPLPVAPSKVPIFVKSFFSEATLNLTQIKKAIEAGVEIVDNPEQCKAALCIFYPSEQPLESVPDISQLELLKVPTIVVWAGDNINKKVEEHVFISSHHMRIVNPIPILGGLIKTLEHWVRSKQHSNNRKNSGSFAIDSASMLLEYLKDELLELGEFSSFDFSVLRRLYVRVFYSIQFLYPQTDKPIDGLEFFSDTAAAIIMTKTLPCCFFGRQITLLTGLLCQLYLSVDVKETDEICQKMMQGAMKNPRLLKQLRDSLLHAAAILELLGFQNFQNDGRYALLQHKAAEVLMSNPSIGMPTKQASYGIDFPSATQLSKFLQYPGPMEVIRIFHFKGVAEELAHAIEQAHQIWTEHPNLTVILNVLGLEAIPVLVDPVVSLYHLYLLGATPGLHLLLNSSQSTMVNNTWIGECPWKTSNNCGPWLISQSRSLGITIPLDHLSAYAAAFLAQTPIQSRDQFVSCPCESSVCVYTCPHSQYTFKFSTNGLEKHVVTPLYETAFSNEKIIPTCNKFVSFEVFPNMKGLKLFPLCPDAKKESTAAAGFLNSTYPKFAELEAIYQERNLKPSVNLYQFNTPNADSFVSFDFGGLAFSVLTDGCGMRGSPAANSNARHFAEFIAEKLFNHIEEEMTLPMFRSWLVEGVLYAHQKTSDSLDPDTYLDSQSTLVASLTVPLGKDRVTLVIRMGDSEAVIYNVDRQTLTNLTPENRRPGAAKNETSSIGHGSFQLDNLQLVEHWSKGDQKEIVLLFSDGVGDNFGSQAKDPKTLHQSKNDDSIGLVIIEKEAATPAPTAVVLEVSKEDDLLKTLKDVQAKTPEEAVNALGEETMRRLKPLTAAMEEGISQFVQLASKVKDDFDMKQLDELVPQPWVEVVRKTVTNFQAIHHSPLVESIRCLASYEAIVAFCYSEIMEALREHGCFLKMDHVSVVATTIPVQ